MCDGGGMNQGGVIIVDDSSDDRELVARQLTRLGAEVRSCSSALEVLALVRQGWGSVLLTDLHMPGMDGIMLSRSVCQLRPELTVILMSGALTDDSRHAAHRAGIAMTVDKPLTDEVLQVVARMGAWQDLHDQRRQAFGY